MPVATSLTKNPPANGFKMSVWCVQPFFKGLKIWPLFPFLQQLHGAIPQWKTRRDAFRNLTKHEKDWGAFIIFYHLLSSTSALIHTNILHGDGGVWPKSCDVTWQLLPTVIQADFPVQGTKTCAGHMYKKTSRSHPLKSPKNPQLCKRSRQIIQLTNLRLRTSHPSLCSAWCQSPSRKWFSWNDVKCIKLKQHKATGIYWQSTGGLWTPRFPSVIFTLATSCYRLCQRCSEHAQSNTSHLSKSTQVGRELQGPDSWLASLQLTSWSKTIKDDQSNSNHVVLGNDLCVCPG